MNKINKEQIFLGAGIVAWIIFLLNIFVLAALSPGYSHITNAFSDLGRIEAPYHKIFNTVIILFGLLYMLTGLGFFYSVKQITGRKLLAIIIGICVALFGVSGVLAGFFPLPDPRHHGYHIGALLIFAPILLAWASWKTHGARPFAFFHLVTFIILVVIATVPLIGASAGDFAMTHAGLIQRIYTLILFIWYILTYYWLTTYKLVVTKAHQ